jgi:hypothetical protein
VSRYRFIEVEKVNHAVRMLCRVLKVSRAAYYHWSIHPLSARARADLALTERIAAATTSSCSDRRERQKALFSGLDRPRSASIGCRRPCGRAEHG